MNDDAEQGKPGPAQKGEARGLNLHLPVERPFEGHADPAAEGVGAEVGCGQDGGAEGQRPGENPMPRAQSGKTPHLPPTSSRIPRSERR